MISAKLSSKYQISIPKAIRESMDIKSGQQFTLITRGSIIEMIPMQSIEDARGSFSEFKIAEAVKSEQYRDGQDRKL
ncbi:AbrB/MazE/SpoVT family DNA-binding domain-containing protein [sulfur-oxidizing endosymbiont of Gigantopelta aegis]|uniref:AbrB/MazE/SpoVT family DNA-binding domain-containing protein n=1 Tax=sulfur-oxidizing endosymbiont of Gigantopelta aegis TaxID=2794934 RepID=UPI0018DDBBE7|nr:AbrB/MazE/SpoVT family DNA-binding domain-containing protein [sulfur-oxidizing endosymbiont of Gigantopelta aegis]